ncbi:hypothetical protein [Leptolyngbya sp. BC1307]|uniref:hypothetical protein n=1 Tax=Leptolyngbya sp. BC1307 TaxID=2029589 RepID=UPI00197D05E6|nr:hypothetical protein [Leptolyngbya sp. BC1307]
MRKANRDESGTGSAIVASTSTVYTNPMIQAALATWEAECLYLSLDTSLFWEEYCLIRLAVVHQGRAGPLA